MTSDANGGGSAQRRGMAVTALVLGILSFVLFCAGPLLSIPAIILGFVARGRANRDASYGGRGVALTGAILGVVNVVLTPLFLVLSLMLAGVTLPALNRAREQSMRLTDAASVRQIMIAVTVYENENGGEFPPHLAAVADKLGDPRVLVSKRSKTTPMGPIPAGKSWHDFAADVDAHCDFAYIGGGMNVRRVSDPVATIVVFSKLLPGDPGRTVGFADGHTEWLQGARLEMALRQTNEYRRKMGLGEVTLDTLIPAAPVTIGPAPAAPGAPGKPQAVEAPKPEAKPGAAPVRRPALPRQMTVDEALASLKTGDREARQTALSFIERQAPYTAQRGEVAAELEKCLADDELRRPALNALRTWSTEENVPGLLALLEKLDADPRRNIFELNHLLEALGNTGDTKRVAAPIAKELPQGFARATAMKVLTDLGSDAEEALWPYLGREDFITVKSACNVLAKIGTKKSIAELEKVDSKSLARRDAETAIVWIKKREGIK
jgi:hypothetical protein